MALNYKPSEISYIIENYLLPARILGRHLKRSPNGVKQMIKRLVEDGRIVKPVPVKAERAWYRWEVGKR
jgi:hypothetical protein